RQIRDMRTRRKREVASVGSVRGMRRWVSGFPLGIKGSGEMGENKYFYTNPQCPIPAPRPEFIKKRVARR
ncbi:hypothetical protein, partial [Fischerella thermalis]|uniref:hypothetical protein n=1 Tax=Fischerella thermalis TaxID=372787 RepID=UPI001CA525D8